MRYVIARLLRSSKALARDGPQWLFACLVLGLAAGMALAGPGRTLAQEAVVAQGVFIDPVNGAPLGDWEALTDGSLRFWELGNLLSIALPCSTSTGSIMDYSWEEYQVNPVDPLNSRYWRRVIRGVVRLGADPTFAAIAQGWSVTLETYIGPEGLGEWVPVGPPFRPIPIALINAAGAGGSIPIERDSVLDACGAGEVVGRPGQQGGLALSLSFSQGSGSSAGGGCRIVGVTWSTDTPPGGGPYALAFNGQGEMVVCPDAPNLRFGPDDPFTISIWFKATGIPASTILHILGKRVGCTNDMNYQLARDGRGLLHFNSQAGPVSSGVDVTPDRWTHLAVTYDGAGNLTQYLGGQVVATESGYAVRGPNQADLEIGASGSCGNTFWGLLDEVRIYRGALDASQIARLAGLST